MRFKQWRGLLAASVVLGGCGTASIPTETQSGGGVAANPIENYKDQRMREAMRGLTYADGRVTLSSEAGQISGRGTHAKAAEQAALGRQVLETNDFPAAIAALTKAVIIAPERAESYLDLSRALLAKGRDREAEAAIRTAIELAPGNIDGHVALARLIDRSGKSAEAIAAWKDVLVLDETYAEAHGRISIASYYLGDKGAARLHIRECERLGGQVPTQFKDLLITETQP